ncbi:hypothetical protein [Mycoplasma sp. 2634B]|uniref:hypothetical protein n=1 Tax=Mycoplasma sp. 2634B TaxID=3401692 RepID=UPI003AAAF01F
MKKLTKLLLPGALSSTTLIPLVAAQCGATDNQEENRNANESKSQSGLVTLTNKVDGFMLDQKQEKQTFDINVALKFQTPLDKNVEADSMSIFKSSALLSNGINSMFPTANDVTEDDLAKINALYSKLLTIPADLLNVKVDNNTVILKWLISMIGDLVNASPIDADFVTKAQIINLGTYNLDLGNVTKQTIDSALQLYQDFTNKVTEAFASESKTEKFIIKLALNVKLKLTIDKNLTIENYINSIFDYYLDMYSKITKDKLPEGTTPEAANEQIKVVIQLLKAQLIASTKNVAKAYEPLTKEEKDKIAKLAKQLETSDPNSAFSIEFK